MIEQIVEQINESIVKLLRCKSECEDLSFKVHGIASPIQVQEEESDKSIPAIILNNGDCEYVFSDDDYSAGCYHRINSKTYGTAKGFGDNDRDTENVEVVLVVWGFQNQLNVSNLEFEREIIVPAIPQKALLVSTDFNSYRVANSEFRNINYLPKPEEFIFALRYKVQYAFERKCLKIDCD